MTKRVSNSRANRHNGRMARQEVGVSRGAHDLMVREAMAAKAPSTVPGNFQIAAQNMIDKGNKQPTGAHRKAAGRGS